MLWQLPLHERTAQAQPDAMEWRGSCPGTFHQTMLPMLGGWSGFVGCVAKSARFRQGLMLSQQRTPNFHRKRSSTPGQLPLTPAQLALLRQPPSADAEEAGEAPKPYVEVTGPRNAFSNKGHYSALEGQGRRLGDASGEGAGMADDSLPAAYLSTDSPAVQQLAMETYGSKLVTVEGDPVPSWSRNRSQEEYAKVLQTLRLPNFEMPPSRALSLPLTPSHAFSHPPLER